MNRRIVLLRAMALAFILLAGTACPPATTMVKTKVYEKGTRKPVPYQVYLHNTFKQEVTSKLINPALKAGALGKDEAIMVISERSRFSDTKLEDIDLLACEDGIIGAFTAAGFTCYEKTNILKLIREPDKGGAFYVSRLTEQAMNELKEAAVSRILLYRIIGMGEASNISASRYNLVREYIVYFRIIDVQNGTVAWSDTVEIFSEPDLPGRITTNMDEKAMQKLFKEADPDRSLEAFEIARTIIAAAVPQEVTRSLDHAGVINEGHLQLGEGYRINEYTHTLEDALIAAMASHSAKAVGEKFSKIQMKLDWQYRSMVFYMNPLCYLNWDEIIRTHGFKQLILFRVIDYQPQENDLPPRCAVFIKIIDLEQGGRAVWAGLAHGPDPEWDRKALALKINTAAPKYAEKLAEKVPDEELAVSAAAALFDRFIGTLPAGVLSPSDKILLLNTQRVAVDHNYQQITNVGMATEDGMVVSLVGKGYGVVEKMASIYINPEEVYNDETFYINPLFLKKLDMLLEYSGSKITKILAYKKIEVEAAPAGPGMSKSKGPELTGLYIRVIDVTEGTIVYSGIVEKDNN